MKIALLADAFPPMRSAAAMQIRDLAGALNAQGHDVVVLIASPDIKTPFVHERFEGFEILRLKTRRTKDVGMIRRAIAEFLISFDILGNLAKSPLSKTRWDGIVWYSPTIFMGPAVQKLKHHSSCSTYLILRDIFPDWAVDLGLMGRGFVYSILKQVERYQYSVADCIGVQSSKNLPYLKDWHNQKGRKLEVLENWLGQSGSSPVSIDISKTQLAGRTILIYAGNMGVAQNLGRVLELVSRVRERPDLGFVFVGRGSEARKLMSFAANLNLQNILFFDEIEPHQLRSLYAQCHLGIVSLDNRHRTHNIPGKLLSYLREGLPVLALLNPGNDLEEFIASNEVGVAISEDTALALEQALDRLLELVSRKPDLSVHCKKLAAERFDPSRAALQIVQSLTSR